MNITDVRIRTIDDEGKLKAIASITIDGVFVVHDIKIIDGQNGLFVAMPSRKIGENNFRDIAHPLNPETRILIRDKVFAAYDEVLKAEPSAESELEDSTYTEA